MTWVIPCKYDGNPWVFDCVATIREHHDDPDIWVIDSASEDTSYLDRLVEEGSIVAEIANRHFAHGAYKWAYENIDTEFFYLWQDSLIVQANLDHLTEAELTSVAWFDQPWGWDAEGIPLERWAEPQMEHHLGYGIPAGFSGIAGPALGVSRRALDEMSALFSLTAETKYHQSALERVYGIVAERCGYSPRRSVLGQMTGHWNFPADAPVRKIKANRL